MADTPTRAPELPPIVNGPTARKPLSLARRGPRPNFKPSASTLPTVPPAQALDTAPDIESAARYALDCPGLLDEILWRVALTEPQRLEEAARRGRERVREILSGGREAVTAVIDGGDVLVEVPLRDYPRWLVLAGK